MGKTLSGSAFTIGFTLGCIGLARDASGEASAPQESRYLVVRYDDYFPREVAVSEGMGLELERRLFELFDDHEARLIVGVVPFPTTYGTSSQRRQAAGMKTREWLSDADNPWVRLLQSYVQKGVLIAALHGYSHLNQTPSGHRPGEFFGQPYDRQLERIRDGRNAMSAALGVAPVVFVPPWNSWDGNTVRALESHGFRWCSADLHRGAVAGSGVRHLPQSSWRPREVLEVLRGVQKTPMSSIIVLVTHPFDFEGTSGEDCFESLADLLSFVESSQDWSCVGPSELPAASSAEWGNRFQRAFVWNRTERFLQDSWGPPLLFRSARSVYRPASWYEANTWRLQVAVWLTMLISVGLGWLVSLVLTRGSLRSVWVWRALAIVAAVSFVVLMLGALEIVERGYGIRGVRLQAIAFALGLAVGIWWKAMSGNRRLAPGLSDGDRKLLKFASETQDVRSQQSGGRA